MKYKNLYSLAQDDEWDRGSLVVCYVARENRCTLRKSCPSATVSTTYPTYSALGLYPGLSEAGDQLPELWHGYRTLFVIPGNVFPSVTAKKTWKSGDVSRKWNLNDPIASIFGKLNADNVKITTRNYARIFYFFLHGISRGKSVPEGSMHTAFRQELWLVRTVWKCESSVTRSSQTAPNVNAVHTSP
jgi:hypothetical protein